MLVTGWRNGAVSEDELYAGCMEVALLLLRELSH